MDIVVKVGGSKNTNFEEIAKDIASLWKDRVKIVFVHGGAEFTDEIATKLGHPPEYVTSVSGYVSRRTDMQTLEIFQIVYCGLLNKKWVGLFIKNGVNAVGISGLDAKTWQGPRKSTIKVIKNGRKMVIRDDYTGKVEKVNVDFIKLLVNYGYLPVISPPAISYENEPINVDGDRAAAVTASKLGAKTLVILTVAPGLLKKFPDENSLIEKIPFEKFDDYLEFAKGKMKKKLMGAKEALSSGVKRVIFADSRIKNPVSQALKGRGTIIE